MLNPLTSLALGGLSSYLAGKINTQAPANTGGVTPSVVSSTGVSSLPSNPYVVSGSGQTSPLTTQSPAVKSAAGTTQYYTSPQTNQYPSAPTLDYSTPYVPQMSWDDAYTRASNMYDPQYDLSRQRTEKMYSDQRARLPQMLAARGYLKGGKREAGEHGITQEQAMALSELQNQFESQKQQAAYNIYSGESGRAQQTLSNLIAQQQAKNTDSVQQWQTQYGAALQKDMQDKLNSNALLRYFTEIFLNE